MTGFQATKTQLGYIAMIASIILSPNNAGMILYIRFNISTITTSWKSLRWTYLVVSSTFDGTYTNIWATFTTISTINNTFVNVPVDSVGSAFLANGGAPKDCNIYIDPLLQVDLQGCQPVPASGIYTGGKPIIHAYISGFEGTFANDTLPTIDVKKGTNSQFHSDSGW